VGQGPLSLLRYRLRRHGGYPRESRCRDPWRRQGRSEPRHQLRKGLFPVEDHVRLGSPDAAVATHEGRQVRQAGRVPAGYLGPGLRHHGGEVQGGTQARWPGSDRHVRLRPVDDLGRLRRQQADEGRLSLEQHRPQRAPLYGLGGVRLHAHLRHGRAHGLLRGHRSGRRFRALGLEHGGDAPGALDPRDGSPPQRAERQGGSHVDVRASQLRAGRHPDDLQPADRPGDPQLHRQPHHPERRGKQGLHREAHQVRQRRYEYRLWPASDRPA